MFNFNHRKAYSFFTDTANKPETDLETPLASDHTSAVSGDGGV